MTVEVDGSDTVMVAQPTQVVTNKLRVREISYDFLDNQMRLEVAFAVDSTNKSVQNWYVSGPPLSQILNLAPVGGTRKAVFRDFVGDVVSRIQNTPGLKADLIAAGNLIIR